jgi:hypothetical protein
MMVDKSPSGSITGKSTDRSNIEVNIYQPINVAARSNPAPTCWYLRARPAEPWATAKKEAARQPTTNSCQYVDIDRMICYLQHGTRRAKIRNKPMLVRTLATQYTLHKMAMAIRKKAKVA